MKGKSRPAVVAIALAVVAMAVPALSAATDKASVTLGAKLTGKAEVPESGDPNGKGDVAVKLKAAKRKVCFTLEVGKLDPIVAGHIHKGDAETAGPVKVTLFEDPVGLDGDGAYEGCVKKVKRKLIKKIIKNPAKYYVNIHTKEYPDGAIRGQLEPLGA